MDEPSKSCYFFSSGVNSTCWRENAALEWRSWELWLENTCRMVSLLLRSWRRPSLSSPWEKPFCRIMVTPNTPGTFYACFLMQRKTWHHYAFKKDNKWTLKARRACRHRSMELSHYVASADARGRALRSEEMLTEQESDPTLLCCCLWDFWWLYTDH